MRAKFYLLPTPVGMFRTCGPRPGRRDPSPHARGDVPCHTGTRPWNCNFSPRPWGCSVPRAGSGGDGALLPTPVGMFRGSRRRSWRPRLSPHARGDVPAAPAVSEEEAVFSPRPWGCSGRLRRRPARRALLPTPVGMFRAFVRRRPMRWSSPHARGDVPGQWRPRKNRCSFSPRPWGCSVSQLPDGLNLLLLPTPVGMFRFQSPPKAPASPSPHARGDVPVRNITHCIIKIFSPRPWGCSGTGQTSVILDRLLPTPVGMFRPRRSISAPPSTSPLARGDVPTS